MTEKVNNWKISKFMKKLKKNKDITSLSNFRTKAISKYYFKVNSRQDVDKLRKIIFSDDSLPIFKGLNKEK